MWKKSRGQEATEFVLITSLVFIASLLTMFIFRDQIALFFKNNVTSQEHKASPYTASTNSATAQGGQFSVAHPGGTIEMDGPSGQKIVVDLPNPTAFTTKAVAAKTTGSSADMLDLASDLGMYNMALSDAVAEIANQTNNPIIDKISKILAQMGQLQGGGTVPGIQNYDTSTNPEWLQALNDMDNDSKVNEKMDSIISSLDATLGQLQDENYTKDYSGNGAFIEDCSAVAHGDPGCWSNKQKFDDERISMTGMKQQDYARFLNQALAELAADSSVPSGVKTAVTAIANEAQKVADQYTYTISEADSNDAFAIMEEVNTKSGYNFGNISGYSSDNKYDRGKKFVQWWKNYTSYSSYNSYNYGFTPAQTTAIANAAKTLSIAVEIPTEGNVTADLAQQIADAMGAAN